MVWLEDPLTGDMPHRTIVEEEDEQQAQELAPQYTVQPEIKWSSGGDTPVAEPILIVLVGQAACLLAGTFLRAAEAVGSIAVPELVRVKSPLEEEFGASQQPVHTSTLCSLSITSSTGAAPAPILLVQSPRELPPEQAVAWARGVLGTLRPQAVAVAATMPAMAYRGPGSPADDDLIFSLRTEAVAPAGSSSSSSGKLPSPLPGATLLGGLPAALLTECELRQLPAALVTGVLMQQVADAQFLCRLGEAVQAAVQAAAGSDAAAAVVRQLPRPQVLAALTVASDNVYRSSASSSIFA